VAAPVVVLIQVGIQSAPVEESTAVRYWHPTLYIRPPPRSLQS